MKVLEVKDLHYFYQDGTRKRVILDKVNADFETGKLLDRVKALVPILVPLFISAFRRADELATAMECRCYQGGDGRTKMKLLRYKLGDFQAFALGIVLLAAVFTVRSFGL